MVVEVVLSVFTLLGFAMVKDEWTPTVLLVLTVASCVALVVLGILHARKESRQPRQ